MLNRICVYCGSSPGRREQYIKSAKQLAKLFAQKDIELVYGGASVGIMGAMADTILEENGKVTGVIPEDLVEKEVAHDDLTNLIISSSMHERKAQMAQLSDGFIALPGGLGTVEELFEMLTWGQLDFHRKPIGILNVCNYYDYLSAFLDHAVSEEFVKKEHRKLLITENNPGKLLSKFEQYTPDVTDKWIGRDTQG